MKLSITEIFRLALDVPPAELGAFLNTHCDSDLMRAQVRALLIEAELAESEPSTLDAQGEPMLDHVLALARNSLFKRAAARDRSGEMLGPFRLLHAIGQGGMGAVWLAERTGDFAQRVAIKWLHAGLSDSARQRFARERETLAKLEHPGIARILDGGSDGDADWFAMEYVPGVALDVYAQTAKPSLRERVTLMIQLCDAVQFAHQNLVVHRDLKPSNILVTANGQPKLLDFGVAKLLGDATATDSRAPMTFAYAAPEQIRGDAITTATDVYALGVILFELLTGERPHKPKGDGSLSLLQAITDTDATAPSSVVREHRQTDHTIKPNQLKGDLDTIVLKTLSRDPARRYASAQALAEDLQRYLNAEPILARQDSAGYRMAKFVRRHALACAAAALAVIAIVAGLGTALILSQRETRALQSAASEAAANSQVSAFLVSLFQAAAPEENMGNPMNAIDMLTLGWQRLQQRPIVNNSATASHDPNDASALIAQAMGESFFGIGEFVSARDAFQYALKHGDAAHSTPRESRLFRAEVTLKLAGSHAELVEFTQARQLVNGLQSEIAALAEPSLQLRADRLLGYIERDSGHYAASIAALNRALSIEPLPAPQKAGLYNSLAFTHAVAGNRLASVAAFEQAEALLTALPAAHPARIWLDYTYGDALRRFADFSQAELRLSRASTALAQMPKPPMAVKKIVSIAQAALALSQPNGALNPALLNAAGLDQLPNGPMKLPQIELRTLYGHWLIRNRQPGLGRQQLDVTAAQCVKSFGAAHPYCRAALDPSHRS